MHSFLRIKDARYFQIIFQAVFLLYGIFYVHWANEGMCFLYYAAVCLATQFLFELMQHKFSCASLDFGANFTMAVKALLSQLLAYACCLKQTFGMYVYWRLLFQLPVNISFATEKNIYSIHLPWVLWQPFY